MDLFSLPLYLFHKIQKGEKDEVKCASGILDKGDKKTGKSRHL